MTRRGAVLAPLLLGGLLLLVVGWSLASGPAPLSPHEVLDALSGRGEPTARAIVRGLRLPRTLLGALVGGALALSGAAFQALLRNPLAEPYVLGVSGGAALGAVGAVVLGLAAATAWALPAAALVGGVTAIALVLAVARAAGPRVDTRVLLLAGVVVGAFFNALILLLLTFAEAEAFRSAVFWMMGSLDGAGSEAVRLLALQVLPSALLLLALARALNLLAVGEETALYLGVRVELVKRAVYLLASLLAASSVAVAGAVGFVGLVVPHALRLAWGSDHRLLLPLSFLGGAAFLVAADTLARTVAAPAEIPVGVVTALVGVPLFVLLLVRRAATGGRRLAGGRT